MPREKEKLNVAYIPKVSERHAGSHTLPEDGIRCFSDPKFMFAMYPAATVKMSLLQCVEEKQVDCAESGPQSGTCDMFFFYQTQGLRDGAMAVVGVAFTMEPNVNNGYLHKEVDKFNKMFPSMRSKECKRWPHRLLVLCAPPASRG